jgi:hypothetical protein
MRKTSNVAFQTLYFKRSVLKKVRENEMFVFFKRCDLWKKLYYFDKDVKEIESLHRVNREVVSIIKVLFIIEKAHIQFALIFVLHWRVVDWYVYTFILLMTIHFEMKWAVLM